MSVENLSQAMIYIDSLVSLDPVRKREFNSRPRRGLLSVNKIGVDLDVEESGNNLNERQLLSQKYEDLCFRNITDSNINRSDTMLIGPRLIDEIFPSILPYHYRPDAISFNTQNPDDWRLTGMYEFKSSEKIDRPTMKLDGFSSLLGYMRLFPVFLPYLLRSSFLDQNTIFPNRIHTPPDNQISVTFISPNSVANPVFQEGDNRFSEVSHQILATPEERVVV